jgi:hypothetical protein
MAGGGGCCSNSSRTNYVKMKKSANFLFLVVLVIANNQQGTVYSILWCSNKNNAKWPHRISLLLSIVSSLLIKKNERRRRQLNSLLFLEKRHKSKTSLKDFVLFFKKRLNFRPSLRPFVRDLEKGIKALRVAAAVAEMLARLVKSSYCDSACLLLSAAVLKAPIRLFPLCLYTRASIVGLVFEFPFYFC